MQLVKVFWLCMCKILNKLNKNKLNKNKLNKNKLNKNCYVII